MNYQDIIYKQSGALVRISQNRPAVRNAQGKRLLDELDHAVCRAEEDESVRAVVIAGEGAHFSAGHDLKEGQRDRGSLNVEERWIYEEKYYYDYCMRIFDLKKPTIAQVQGACLAGAFMVANMCDIIIASEDAYFADPVAHSFGSASLEVLIHPWVLGSRKARELLFTGRRFDAAEALEIGMVNQVVPRDKLEDAVTAMGERIAQASPFALRLVKRSLNRTLEAQGFKVALAAHFDTHVLSHNTQEFKTRTAGGLDTAIAAGKIVTAAR